jgi:two-component system sensor histidine kinase RpfC
MSSSTIRVLIVDDVAESRDNVEKLLRFEPDIQVVGKAARGQEGIDLATRLHPDVVLMDINMPDMDGIETVKLLRFMHKPADLPPIVALSADATPETQAACREIGFSAYLLKPIDTGILLRTLTELTGDAPEPAASVSAAPVVGPAPVDPELPQAPALDQAKLASLARLDTGDGFLAQVIDDFIEDGAGLIERIGQAVVAGDARAFRDEAHALRSSAGYIGAAGLFSLCLSWRSLDDDALILRGRAEIARLREEFERVRTALTAAKPAPPISAAAGRAGQERA